MIDCVQLELTGMPVNEVWSILINQAFINGSISLLYFSIISCLLFCLIKKLFIIKEKMDSDEMQVSLIVLAVLLVILFLCVMPEFLTESVISFSNPEYWVLRELSGL